MTSLHLPEGVKNGTPGASPDHRGARAATGASDPSVPRSEPGGGPEP